MKVFSLFQKLPERMKSTELKQIFFNIIDDRANEFVAKKVAKLNGDIRVAFDLIKTAFSTLAFNIGKIENLPEYKDIKITINLML